MVLDQQSNRSPNFASESFGETYRSPPVGAEMQLSVVTQFFPPDFAATGQLIEELVHQFRQSDIDVKVFTGQPSYAFHSASAPLYEKIGSLQVKRSRSAQFWPKQIRGKAINGVVFTIRAGLHLLKNYRRRNLLVVTTAPPFLPVLGYLNHLLFKVPYVCVLYDLYPDIAIELGVVSHHHWLARFWRGMNERVWRNARGLIVLSPDMKQRIISHCPEVADKVSVIHSWSDPSWITPVPKNKNWFALRYDLIQPFTILYSGNMGRCHDMETILETAKLLRDQPIQFVCIGNGAKRKILREQTQKLGLSNFLFLPYQDREVLPYSLTACDLSLVSVSEGVESLVAPSKLYPALSAGRPVTVICPRHSYLNHLIEEAQCGKTFINGDAEGLAAFIRLLMGDRELAEQMGQSGRRYLKNHFTPKIIAQQYLEVLLQAMTKQSHDSESRIF
ncbi:MAG: glycosyltransferase family 4 protein [Cyanobacteria bacterium CAN_BIN43]|nr:glycosyltransferase family 4 protein [Cyanobacteria bacterium CAN_BIN43]